MHIAIGLPVFKPKTPAEISNVEDAMAAVITITTNDLGLPVVEPLYLHLHKDTETFAAKAGRLGRRLPSNVAQFAIAVAEENRFHINMEKTRGRPWGALLRILAHEYAHNVEYVFSSLYRGSQWIREGFADWVAAKVLHSLRWQEYTIALRRAAKKLAPSPVRIRGFTTVERLGKPSDGGRPHLPAGIFGGGPVDGPGRRPGNSEDF